MGGFSGNPIDPHMMAIISALSNNIGGNAPPGMFPDASVSGAMGQGPQVQGSPIQGSIPEQSMPPGLAQMLGGQSPDMSQMGQAQMSQPQQGGHHHILSSILRALGGAAQASLQGGSDALNHSLGLPTQYEKGLTQQELDIRRQYNQAMSNYKMGDLGVKQEKADTQKGHYRNLDQQGQEKVDNALILHGLNPETGEAIPEDQLPAQVRSRVQLNSALEMKADAESKLANMKADPDSTIYKMQLQRLQTAKQNAQTAAARLGLSQQQFERDTFGTSGGQAIPGAAVDQSGAPMGFKAPLAPTTQTKTGGQAAQSLLPHIDEAGKMIDALVAKGKLGNQPISGGWNTFKTNKLRMNDPEFKALNDTLDLIDTKALSAHLPRGAMFAYKDFKNRLNTANTAGNMKASLGVLRNFMQSYVQGGQSAQLPKYRGGKTPVSQPQANDKDPLGILQ